MMLELHYELFLFKFKNMESVICYYFFSFQIKFWDMIKFRNQNDFTAKIQTYV